jgi:hypothetical protein
MVEGRFTGGSVDDVWTWWWVVQHDSDLLGCPPFCWCSRSRWTRETKREWWCRGLLFFVKESDDIGDYNFGNFLRKFVFEYKEWLEDFVFVVFQETHLWKRYLGQTRRHDLMRRVWLREWQQWFRRHCHCRPLCWQSGQKNHSGWRNWVPTLGSRMPRIWESKSGRQRRCGQHLIQPRENKRARAREKERWTCSHKRAAPGILTMFALVL